MFLHILSYQVEWDSKAGIPEVQRIATSLNLDTNEIQTITTSAEDIDEVQIITSSAISQGKVQTITVSPPPGENTLNSLYGYSLKLDTVGTGGSVQYSGEISATANAFGSRSSLQESLGAMSNIDSLPQVSKSGMNPDGGYTYSITFPTSMRDVPELEVYLSEVPIYISTLENANLLDGFFRLEYNGDVTELIPSDADESQMKIALEELPSIGDVVISRSMSDDQNGFTWTVQFVSTENSGNLDNLIVHSDDITTSNAMGGASITVVSGSDGSYIEGTFLIKFGKFRTHFFYLE
jgi:hypothetical protein